MTWLCIEKRLLIDMELVSFERTLEYIKYWGIRSEDIPGDLKCWKVNSIEEKVWETVENEMIQRKFWNHDHDLEGEVNPKWMTSELTLQCDWKCVDDWLVSAQMSGVFEMNMKTLREVWKEYFDENIRDGVINMSMRKERKYSEWRNTVKEKKMKKKTHYMNFDWGITWDKFKN